MLENLTAHKTRKGKEAFAALGVDLYYLPPYAPDLNPIEKYWSKLKTYLPTKAARSYQLLSEAFTKGLKTITATDAENWIRHCAYV